MLMFWKTSCACGSMNQPPANFFGRLKEFKRIAMRADKTDQSFASMIHLAAAVINSR